MKLVLFCKDNANSRFKHDTLSEKDRKALNNEYQSLNEELDRLAGSTTYNRQSLTNGADLGSGNAQIQVGPQFNDQIALPTVDFRTVSTGLNGSSIATASDAGSALSALDSAIKNISSQRSVVGSTINRLESSVNNIAVAAINTQAAESVVRDEDVADGLMELTRTRLLQEGNVAAFSRFNEISQTRIMGLMG
jgi:flagellin